MIESAAVQGAHDLPPESRELLETYLSRVHGALLKGAVGEAEDTIAELRAHVLDELADTDGSPAALSGVLAEFGPPEDLAAGFSAGGSDDAQVDADDHAEKPSALSGRVLGLPYELRIPTAKRIASRWWDPRNPRVFVPRVFGVGWDVNFGALAVLLHLIEPDAEDEPFAAVSDRAFLAALLVPVGLTAFVIGSYLAVRGALPPTLPAHWTLAGRPDSYWPALGAFAVPLVMSVSSTVWAVWTVARSRSGLARAATIGFAAFLSAVSAGVWTLTLITAMGAGGQWWLPPVCVSAGVWAPLAVLSALARSGRAAEQRRDMDAA